MSFQHVIYMVSGVLTVRTSGFFTGKYQPANYFVVIYNAAGFLGHKFYESQ